MSERIGVILCRCGDNVAGLLDLPALERALAAIPGVAFVAAHDLPCSPDGLAFVTERLRAGGATHAVVVGCSPKEHEATFRAAAAAAGLNPFLLQMANVREHCTWVTKDPAQAQGKALALARAAIARVKLHEPIDERSIPCTPDVLVIGGGVAGIEAALLAAAADRAVTLVEAAPSIGGVVAQLEEAAPDGECAPCLLAPRLAAVSETPNLKLLTNAEVTKIAGFLGNFEVEVRERARWVNAASCIGCDECIPACPVEVPSPFDHGLRTRKAITMPFPGCVPNCAVIDREACLRTKGEACTACAAACPLEAIDFTQADQTHTLKVGAIVLATGAAPFDPTALPALGYGRLPEVYTLPEVERLLSTSGPTGGQLRTRDGRRPGRVTVVHCVGREALGACSGVCCQAAALLAVLANKEEPACEVVHLTVDEVAPDRLAAALFDKARGHGARFVRVGDPAATRVAAGAAGLTVVYRDAGGGAATVDCDMVVLVTGLAASAGTRHFADQLGLAVDPNGFPLPDHLALRPAQSSLEGVYLGGCAAGPRTIAQSVALAQAATGAALGRLVPGRLLKLEAVTSSIDEQRCAGCLTCVIACPYQACTPDPATGRVQVNEVLCRGRGTCVAACPSGAARARHFTDEQLLAEIVEVTAAAATDPRVLVFVCNFCSYGGADKAGGLRLDYPAGARLVRVMCSGRVDPQLVLQGFRAGADGVLILGCHPGDCHFKAGNYHAARRAALLALVLAQLGIERERFGIDWVSAGEGERFQKVVAEFYGKVAALPRLRLATPQPAPSSGLSPQAGGARPEPPRAGE